MSYRNIGTGNDCAGHNIVMLCLRRISIVLLLSPDVNLGETLPTGSAHKYFHYNYSLKHRKRAENVGLGD